MVVWPDRKGDCGGVPPASGGEEWKWGKFAVELKGSRWHLLVDALAFDNSRVMLLSVAGPETAIKAVNACLGSNTNARFESDVRPCRYRTFTDPGGVESYCPTLIRHEGGYDTYKARLGYNTWHLLAVSKAHGFMPCLSETALDRELRSSRFTTPYLREWVPEIAKKLFDSGSLALLDGFQTDCALLKAGTPELDALITMGVSEGRFLIPRREVA